MNRPAWSVTEDEAPATPLPRRASGFEIALVLGLPTLVWVSASVLSLTHRITHASISDLRLLTTVAEEAVFCALFLPFLRGRGWTPAAVAGDPVAKDALRGVLLWLGSFAVYVGVWIACVSLAPGIEATLRSSAPTGGASAATILLVSLVNGVFEEFLWLGYGVTALGPRLGVRGACLVSIVLRVAIHAYQGPMALVGIAPLAVVFTAYYARSGRLWPVVMAHVLADVAGLATLHR